MREPRLVQETGPEALVLGELRRDQLERDRPLERYVPGPVDDPMPPRPSSDSTR
jgi:hypothetical protein